MLYCMRTTLELDDALALEAKKAALDRRTTLRALVQDGLRLLLHGQAPGKGRPASPLDGLRGLHRRVWAGTDPDEYVRQQREGW